MRKKIVAGNWKMNLNYAEAMALADSVAETVHEDQETNVILAPPFIYLHEITQQVLRDSVIAVAAQNCSDKKSGPYTGETASSMLASIGVDYVIVGHSERRNYFHEENSLLAEKVKRALENSLLPIYCCGETALERDANKQVEIVQQQIEQGLFHLPQKQLEECVIAYEPVWAIGTGINATPAQAQEMHQFIRRIIAEKYGQPTADKISILYGGSVTAANADEIFSCPDVDGGLVGGASLKINEFTKIIEAMEKVSRKSY
jgi:triosephosphate isomerase